MFGKNRKVVLFICLSIDGYISTLDDDISFLQRVEQAGEDYGYAEFMNTVDTVIIGRKTYEKVKSMVGSLPYAKEKTCYVISRNAHKNSDTVLFYSGEAKTLIDQIRTKDGATIFCDGGAEIVHWLMKDQLIDELKLFICPVLLGNGKRLFNSAIPFTDTDLLEAKTYPSGLTMLHYRLKR